MRRLALYSLYIVTLFGCLGSIAYRPMAFQKSSVVTEASTSHDRSKLSKSLDVATFLGDITYTDQQAVVYEIHPKRKYEQTIVEGKGNCSNLSFGAAYDLRRQEIPYDIVSFLPRQEFLDGWGHTIVSTRCILADSTFDCLVDVLEGGIPLTGMRTLSLADLYSGAVPDFSILSLNKIDNTVSDFYGDFLDKSTIGILQSEDIDRYFAILERIYIPLGHSKVEKLAYDGLAVAFGFYPRIRVLSIDETFRGAAGVRRYYVGVLWLLRLAMIAGLAIVIYEVRRFSRRRRPRRFT